MAGLPGGRYGLCFRYIGCVMYMILLEGQMAFFAERVGFGLECERVCEFSRWRRNGRPWWWCPDRLIALYGRGDDDDDAGVVIGLTGTGVPHYHYFLYRMSRTSQGVAAAAARRRRGARIIGWYLSRRTARVQKAN